MALDHFAVLGLSPGVYQPEEIERRFAERRGRLLLQLYQAGGCGAEGGARLENRSLDHAAVREKLDALHLARTVLVDRAGQAACLEALAGAMPPVDELRSLIAASMENGLLRHSRRQMILDRARGYGLSEFQTHLLIAQVQFGDDGSAVSPRPATQVVEAESHPRTWARVAAVGVLALAMLIYMVRMVGG